MVAPKKSSNINTSFALYADLISPNPSRSRRQHQQEKISPDKKKRWRQNTLRQSVRRWIIYRRPFELFKRGRTAIESTARSIQFLVRCLFFFYLSLRSFDDASVRSSPTARARNRLLTKRLKGNGRGRKLADIALVGRVVFCCCLIQYKRRHSSMISH